MALMEGGLNRQTRESLSLLPILSKVDCFRFRIPSEIGFGLTGGREKIAITKRKEKKRKRADRFTEATF